MTDVEKQKELILNSEKIISIYSNSGLQAIEILTITHVQLADAKEKVYDYENKMEIFKQKMKASPNRQNY